MNRSAIQMMYLKPRRHLGSEFMMSITIDCSGLNAGNNFESLTRLCESTGLFVKYTQSRKVEVTSATI